MATKTILNETTTSLEKIQQFDVLSLGRVDDLGKQMSFSEIIEYAEAIVNLYKRLSLAALNDFSDTYLNAIKNQSNNDFNIFQQILSFDATTANAATSRTQLINQMKVRRDQLFDQIWQFIAYGVARNTDVSVLEAQARATIQSITDQSSKLIVQINAAKNDADEALNAIRTVAAEQGVSQQAIYFKLESEKQEELAGIWLKRTYLSAAGVGVFAFLSLFLYKWDWIRPHDTSEMMQFITSKILIFAVLGYLLLLSARC